jgi:hypothetical protein
MDFLPNTIVIWTTTNLTIARAWREACQQIISMTYVPTLTSGMEGQHSLESGHHYGRALDFRSKDVPFELRMPLKNRVQELLGSDYLVLLEESHYHIQRQKESFV